MYNKKVFFVLSLIAAMLTVTACNVGIIQGSGNLITEKRQVSDFEGIALSGPGRVIVVQAGSESLTIETDDNVMKHIKAVVENGILKLGFEEGFNSISPSRLIFYVRVKDLTSLTIVHTGDIEAKEIKTDRLDVTLNGTGGFDLAGSASIQNVMLSGTGRYEAGELCGISVEVNIKGSGDVTVCATDTLDVSISESGSVNYYGRPAVNGSVGGSGKITSLGEK